MQINRKLIIPFVILGVIGAVGWGLMAWANQREQARVDDFKLQVLVPLCSEWQSQSGKYDRFFDPQENISAEDKKALVKNLFPGSFKCSDFESDGRVTDIWLEYAKDRKYVYYSYEDSNTTHYMPKVRYIVTPDEKLLIQDVVTDMGKNVSRR